MTDRPLEKSLQRATRLLQRSGRRGAFAGGLALEPVIDAMRAHLDLPYLRGWADKLLLRKRLEAFLATPVEGHGR